MGVEGIKETFTTNRGRTLIVVSLARTFRVNAFLIDTFMPVVVFSRFSLPAKMLSIPSLIANITGLAKRAACSDSASFGK